MATLGTTIGWLTVQEVLDLWPDAPGEDLDNLAELANLMGTAHEFLKGKGPNLEPPPESYKSAQILYMKHLWARGTAGNGDTMGPDGYQVSTFPMVLEAIGLMKLHRRRVRGLR
jgi:hypothetical protein